MVMCLMATAALAEVTAPGLVQKDAWRTPADPTASPATTEEVSPDVQALIDKAKASQDRANAELASAQGMGNKEDAARTAASNARLKSLAAGAASVDHTEAEDTHKHAKELAAAASAAAAKAIQAGKDADAAKAHFENMKSAETDARTKASQAIQAHSQAKVQAEAKTAERKRLEDAQNVANVRETESDEKKKAADDVVFMTTREKKASKEVLDKATAAKEAAAKAWDAATKKAQTAEAELDTANSEEARLGRQLGQQQADCAHTDVQKTESEKEREMARALFDTKMAQMHTALEEAHEAEAQATAAGEEANRLKGVADTLAKKVGDMGAVQDNEEPELIGDPDSPEAAVQEGLLEPIEESVAAE